MKKYTILIEETTVKQFTVSASSREEALKSSIANYNKGKFVLDPGEVQSKKISFLDQNDEFSSWTEF